MYGQGSRKKPNGESYHDIPALKELIRNLRIRDLELHTDSEVVSKEILELDEKAATLKSEINVLSSIDNVRIHAPKRMISTRIGESDQSIIIDEPDSKVRFDKKFAEANLKLDLKILSTETKNCLPALEAEALKWEEKFALAQSTLKNLKFEYDQLPPELTLSSEQIKKDISRATATRDQLQAYFEKDRQRAQTEVRTLSAEAKALLEDLKALNEEFQLVATRRRHSQRELRNQQARCQWLAEKIVRLKREFLDVDKRGWPVVLFSDITGGEDGHVTAHDTARFLPDWLVSPSTPDTTSEWPAPPAFCTVDSIDEATRNVISNLQYQARREHREHAVSSDRIDLQAFLSICETLESQTS